MNPTTIKATAVKVQSAPVNSDSYDWTNQYGGSWSLAANWIDTSINSVPVGAPTTTNLVTITGGVNGMFTNITGAGSAAQLSIGNDVLLWGTVTVAGAVTIGVGADLELDGSARIVAGSLSIGAGSSVNVGSGSVLKVIGNATLSGGSVLATSGSIVQLGALVANAGVYSPSPYSSIASNSVIAVDDNSSIEVGATGGAAAGAITIDKGQSAAVRGTIDGNVTVNGTLGVQAGGQLTIDADDPFGSAQGISGSGTLVMSENSGLTLGVADSAGIQFAGVSGKLSLAALPSGTISGFAVSDVIQIGNLATGLSYAQTSASLATLTLTKGSKAVGTLKLGGNYQGSLFHLSVNAAGTGLITLQTIGSAPMPPNLIVGTVGQDTLSATANNQTLTGLGGGDILQGGTFSAIVFKDTSADLNGSTIASFTVSDIVDLTDIQLNTASVTYSPGSVSFSPAYYSYTPPVLTVSDGTHTATIGTPDLTQVPSRASTNVLPAGYFSLVTDGAAGTDVKYVVVNADAYSLASPLGGNFGLSAGWQDTTTSVKAMVAPGYGNAVTITGGAVYTDLTGNGVAASLATSLDVRLFGTVTVGSKVAGVSGALTQTGTLALDGGAALTLAGDVNIGGVIKLSGGSKLIAAGTIASTGSLASLLVTGGSLARFAGISGGSGYPTYNTAALSVDATSSIEIGSVGSVAAGAVTIDSGVTTNLSSVINGSVVVNGTIVVASYSSLAINSFGTVSPSVGGTGLLEIMSGATLGINGVDSAAIQFVAGSGFYPSGTATLSLAGALPTGSISGFVTGDVISVAQPVTSLTYSQTGAANGTLTLLNGSAKVGTLSLTGSYTGSLFGLGTSSGGVSRITVQPGLLVGTAGREVLTATANNQTLTGMGGGDTLQGSGFTGIAFKDSSVDLGGSAITSFDISDVIDLTDMKLSGTTANFVPAVVPQYSYMPTAPSTLTITDGTHTAALAISFAGNLPTGYFALKADGAGGTDATFVTVNTDAYLFVPPSGGDLGAPSNWRDTTTSTKATLAPSYGNVVTLAGGTTYTNLTGSGIAAGLVTSGDVLLWGTLNVGSKVGGVSGSLTQTGTLALDGGAALTLAGSANIAGSVELSGGSKLIAAGSLTLSSQAASLLITGGSSAQFSGYQIGFSSVSAISVDATSSIEFGTVGNATAGALTIDSGVTTRLGGTIDSSVVVNGTLAVAGTSLAINRFGTVMPSVGGTGLLEISNSSTLTLTGTDSAAILFDALTGYSFGAETLALGGSLPTGKISGFATGDVISLTQIVTGLTYSQTGTTSGTLTLVNGSASIGTLSLVGSYVASQFVLSFNGLASSITYAPTPSLVAGNQVSSSSDSYSWTSTGGGAWSNAANWSDVTTNATTRAAPGVRNAVAIGTNSPSTTQIISGSGSAASLALSSTIALTGNITVAGQITAYYGAVTLESGAKLNGGSLVGSAAFLVAGGSTLNISGLTSAGMAIGSSLSVVGGSSVTVVGEASVDGMISVDSSSSVELGADGGAASGALTIDNGQGLRLAGTIAANLVLNGNLLVSGSSQQTIGGFGGVVGSVSGTGTIYLSAGDLLVLNAADSAGIAFAAGSPFGGFPAASTLELKGPLPTGAISGFAPVGSSFGLDGPISIQSLNSNGSSIQVDQTVTGVSFSQTTSTPGTLTLTAGAAVVGTLTFSDSFTGGQFHVDVDPTSGFGTITLQTAGAVSGTDAASTGTDAYLWSGANGGSWTTATNWYDSTTTTTPATVAGSGNAVSVAGSTAKGLYTSIGGSGAAASLAVSGNVMLTGRTNITGKLGVGPAPGSTLALDGGAKLTAASAALSGRLQVGGGSSAAISGTATLTNGALLAIGGSTVQLGGLISTAGNIAVDANSIIKIGTPLTAVAGALTQAAGTTAVLTGSVFGNVVANGTLAVAGGDALFIDLAGMAKADPYSSKPSIGGTGTFWLTEGSTLGLGVVDTAAIQFAAPNATLVLASLPTGTITGFAVSDQIQIDQTVTRLSYRQVTANAGTLTLTNGTTTIGALQLAGSYGAGTAFHLEAAANGNSAVITLQSLGLAPTQPALIQGTAATDLLTATANQQTISGLGGADTLSGGSFTGINFKDLSANLNGVAIQDFVTLDSLDLTDMNAGKTTVRYVADNLLVTDGTHSAALKVDFLHATSAGAITITSDGSTGTKLMWS